MSDLPIRRDEDRVAIFRPHTIAWLLLIGVLGFVGMVVLGAYAPDLRTGHNGGGHALSNAAIGYSGLVRLADATRRNPRVIRDAHQWTSGDLLVATPESGSVNMSDIIAERKDKPTLLILPKWAGAKDADHPGWVRVSAPLPIGEPQGVLAPQYKLQVARHGGHGRKLVPTADLPQGIAFTAPRQLQLITAVAPTSAGPIRLQPLLTDGAGGIVLGKLDGRPLYVLSDPDLFDNAGMKDPAGAASALALLDWMNAAGARAIDFDVTLNGLARSRSPLKLLFDPPFLAMTLAILAVLLLLGWHALGRFGAPRPRERAIAFGKAALVDNSAILMRKARRSHRLAGRYVEVVREHAVQAFGVSPRLKGAAIDAYLDGLGGGTRFTELAAAAEAAGNTSDLLAAARALHAWQQERRA
jgi:hypothetical protein